MENNDSPIKPQPTGGLKLMTVFIAVLALHVLVIGGFTVYHLMSGGSTDADLLTDKTHKTGAVASDGQMPDASATSTTATTAPTDGATTVANPSATEPGATTPATTAPATTAPATASSTSTPAPATPLQSDLVTSPPDIAPVPATAAEIASGPVKMPATQPPAQPDNEIQTTVTSTAAPAPDSEVGTPYVVKAHDSLARIAHHHHVTIAELKSANNLTTDFLSINQKLVIPASTSSTTTVAAAGTDASGPILAPADSTGVSSGPSPKKHKAAKSAVAESTVTPSHHVYTVVKGDTLTRIAHKFKTTPTALMAANNITDPAKLSIGKKLKIPSMESRSAKNTAPAPATQPAAAQTAAPTPQLANFIQ